MDARFAVSVFAALMLAACQPQQQAAKPAAPEQAAQSAAPSEPLDPFVVMVDAERWGVIIDKALEGIRETPDPNYGANVSDEMYRADNALKSNAARLIELRNEACVKKLITGAACELKDWPAWTLDPPTANTPIEEIDRRSQWLSEQMGPFTEAGCEAGRKATKDDLFCSVE